MLFVNVIPLYFTYIRNVPRNFELESLKSKVQEAIVKL